MFYPTDQRDRTRLPHDPIKAIVAPRPIGWISTLAPDGSVNLAPYSFFNQVCSAPPIVMFSSDGAKHSASNAEATGEFVCSLATFALRQQMNATSAPLPAGQSEFAHAGLTPAPSRLVTPPRVQESPAALECRVVEILRPRDATGRTTENIIIFGQVIGVYIHDDFIVDGRFDMVRAGTISRAGYADYVHADSVFSIIRPNGG